MPPEYIAALKAFAFQSGVSLAEYVPSRCMTASSKEVPPSGKEVPLSERSSTLERSGSSALSAAALVSILN
jgi:hypothetical protein